MLDSLLDRLGLGGERAIANARHEMLRPQREAEIVARLVDSLARRDVARALADVEGRDDPPAAAVDTAA